MIKVSDLFSPENSLAGDKLFAYEYPWEVLPDIGRIILEIGETLSPDEYEKIKDNIWISKEAKVYDSAYIKGPCIIGKGTEVRVNAFIRGNALIGENCVVGNSCEIKNVILFNNVQVPHFNYIGDSILGFHAHFGAGAVTSNVKSDKTNVVIKFGKKKINTGLRKAGAFVGDNVEVGCNAVLNPGTVIGRSSVIYPLSSVRGVIEDHKIYKGEEKIVEKL